MIIFIIPFVCYALFIFLPAHAQGQKTVAVFPFKMNASGDMAYLREGLMDMLTSRLTSTGEIRIVEQKLVNKKIEETGVPDDIPRALTIGRALQSDYVILGSLTAYGESVSIDAKILDVAKPEELMTVFKQSKGTAEFIPAIDQFVLDIKNKISGRLIPPPVKDKLAQAPPIQAKAPEQPVPAKAAKETKVFGPLISGDDASQEMKSAYAQDFKYHIKSLDIGDVDGDGKKELVFVDDNTVSIWKWNQQSFVLFKQIKGIWGPNYVHVSLGDINRNGRDEIYVSNPEGPGISSFVLEWDGLSFKKIAGRQPWFFRIIEIPGQGRTLIGQKRNTRSHFQGKVHILKPEKSGYSSTGTLNLPPSANALNFALLQAEGSKGFYSVVLNENDYLTLFDPNNKRVWTSKDHFGGTYAFLSMDSERLGDEERYYMPSPINITDLNEDGRPEIMVCKNSSMTWRLVSRARFYSGGEVHFLAWDKKAGLNTQWKTGSLSGAVSGYRVADFNGDGKKQLVIASVMAQDGIISTAQSQISVYDLP